MYVYIYNMLIKTTTMKQEKENRQGGARYLKQTHS